MNKLATRSKGSTISSLEVAEMIEKEHSKLLKDIRRYSEQLNEAKIGLVDFFQESTYVDAKGETRLCYEVTRKGCEFIANKLTGIKGTVFTAKFINRFHDMEDYIQSENKVTAVSFKEQVESLEPIANILNMNQASRLLLIENFYKGYHIPTGFLPKYESNGSREMKASKHLLSENGCDLSVQRFNALLIEQGYLEERERPSGKGKGVKKFKALTRKGLQYGENAVSPYNQREVQPLYYSDRFMELYTKVSKPND